MKLRLFLIWHRFEGIASIRIARIKDKVVASKQFFAESWQIYTQLRQDTPSQVLPAKGKHKDKSIFVAYYIRGWFERRY